MTAHTERRVAGHAVRLVAAALETAARRGKVSEPPGEGLRGTGEAAHGVRNRLRCYL